MQFEIKRKLVAKREKELVRKGKIKKLIRM